MAAGLTPALNRSLPAAEPHLVYTPSVNAILSFKSLGKENVYSYRNGKKVPKIVFIDEQLMGRGPAAVMSLVTFQSRDNLRLHYFEERFI